LGSDLSQRLEQWGGQGGNSLADVPLASAQLLHVFNRRRDYGYAWRGPRQVEDLLRLAESSVDDGLQPSDFHAQEISGAVGGLASPDLSASKRVDLDILLSDSLLRLIHHQRCGKVDPQLLSNQWSYAVRPYADELLADLERAVAAASLQEEVEAISAEPAIYARLKQGLTQYRGIAAAGGWPTVPAGKQLKPGMTDPAVPAVRARLRATGNYKGLASDSPKYDPDLEVGVRAFQDRHHLGVDGVVGPRTRAAMNISAEKRVDQIRVNLERMRWVSDRLPEDLLLADITGQEARLLRDKKVVWTSRVIIGRPERPTPVLRDQVEYLEINPSWTVPPTILRKDILPAMRRNLGYLKRKGLQVVTRDGKPVSAGSVNWNMSAASFPYMIRQPPGVRNALGQISFSFPTVFRCTYTIRRTVTCSTDPGASTAPAAYASRNPGSSRRRC
jgi:murein L,D-transpeptidase YcbB/YkuD